MSTSYVSPQKVPALRESLNETFRSGLTKPLEWRQHQLVQLARMVKENHTRFAEAIFADLGRGAVETYSAEIKPVLDRSLICFSQLPMWMQAEWKPATKEYYDEFFESWKPRVYHEPKGTVLIISPWNFPVILTLQPLLGAITAGCCALIKPSEIAPNYAALLADLLPKYLDNRAYKVALGAVEEVTALLKEKWDHIFYTGNGTVARIVSAAAAKHLTPLTLELGGKNPVILDPAFPDVKLAARRTLWGKTGNAGQFCVAPDFVLLSPETLQPFLDGLKEAMEEFYPPEARGEEEVIEARYTNLSKIVSQHHFDRLLGLLADTKGKVVLGGNTTKGKVSSVHKIAPTVVVLDGPGWQDDALMKTENFGPVLPVVVLRADSSDQMLQQALEFIRSHDHPLVLYAFSENDDVKELIRSKTLSGSLVFNDTTMQLAVNAIPFGGVGESGHGRQIIRYTFEEFSYLRSCVDVPTSAEDALKPRYPPYTKEKADFWINATLSTAIPASPLESNKYDMMNGL